MNRVHPNAGWQVAQPPDHRSLGWRLVVHLVLAALPLLAISAHVFEVVPMHLTAGVVVLPLLVIVLVLSAIRPIEQDRMLVRAAVVGAIATAVYDTVRLDTVYILGLWGDFIPNIGAWVLDTDDPVTGLVTAPGAAEVIVGYLWRYVGDGAGIGIWFFVVASALGLRDRGRGATIAAAVAFAVAPVWTGLIATVALAPRASELMFPINGTTFSLSLLGHLIFGLVLGIGTSRTDRLERLWPCPELQVPIISDALNRIGRDRSLHASPQYRLGEGSCGREVLRAAGWSAALSAAQHQAYGRQDLTQLLPPAIEARPRDSELIALLAPIPVGPARTPRLAIERGRPPNLRDSGIIPPTPQPDRLHAGSVPSGPVPIVGPPPGGPRMPRSPSSRPDTRFDPARRWPSSQLDRGQQRAHPQGCARASGHSTPPVAWGRIS